MPERKGTDILLDFNEGIEVSDVSFKYPGAEKTVLNNVSIRIRKSETIALVGENGAGKTTLVRLITGLYLPTCGTVKIGNIDTKDVSARAAYRGISAVFQKFQRYKLTLRDNINISDSIEMMQ